MKKKIIGTFVFYDEDHLLIPQIESLLSFCDEVVALGNSPTTKALEIAQTYVRKNKFTLILDNNKKNNFYDSDEYGDRQKVLNEALKIGCDVYFYTDVDEIVSQNSSEKLKKYLQDIPDDVYGSLYRYDFWENAHNYRLKHNPGEEIENAKPPMLLDYFCSTKHITKYLEAQVPNFHALRLPFLSKFRGKIIFDDIKILHYGYMLKSIIKKKENFWLTNPSMVGNCWSEDMKMNLDDFKKNFGVGFLNER